MTATKYTYAVSETVNNLVDSDRLTQEIRDAAIPVALDYLAVAGADLDVWFKAALDAPDEAVLDGLVAAHTGEPLPDPPARVTPDGRPMVMPLSYEDGTFLYVCGAGDHATNGRAQGQPFRLQRTTAGTSSVEWQFNDWVQAVGGTGAAFGCQFGDEVTVEMFAPATTAVAVTPGTGSCVWAPTGWGFDALVPYAGGTHDIDHAVPVPASVGEASYWSWAREDFGPGVLTPHAGGGFNLYSIDIPLTQIAPRLQLVGDRTFNLDVQHVKPMITLPQWKGRATLVTAGADHTVSVAWEIQCVRMRTTVIW